MTMAPVTTAADVADPPERASEIGGALPDGTPYTVRFDRSVDQTVQSIRAAVMIDRDDGTSWFLGPRT